MSIYFVGLINVNKGFTEFLFKFGIYIIYIYMEYMSTFLIGLGLGLKLQRGHLKKKSIVMGVRTMCVTSCSVLSRKKQTLWLLLKACTTKESELSSSFFPPNSHFAELVFSTIIPFFCHLLNIYSLHKVSVCWNYSELRYSRTIWLSVAHPEEADTFHTFASMHIVHMKIINTFICHIQLRK